MALTVKGMTRLFSALLVFLCSLELYAQSGEREIGGTGFKEAGHGAVHMPGAILDAACAISTDSEDQTVNLKLTNVNSIVNLNYGNSADFVITLDHCTKIRSDGKTQWKSIKAIFSGTVDEFDQSLFSLVGSVRGVGIRLQDEKGVIINPGEVIIRNDTPNHTAEFRCRVMLVADSNIIRRGIGRTLIQLRLDYD